MKHTVLPINLKSFLFLLVLVNLIWVPARAADYYWVNGSGNWSDYANHWATTSGGSIFHTTIPTLNDDVHFDANSFTANNQSVYFDNTFIYCNNMDWTGVQFNPSGDGLGNTMHIYGSLQLVPAMSWNVKRIDFKGSGSGNTVSQSGHLLDTLYFNGPGTFALTEATDAKSIFVYDGTFSTNGNDVTAQKFYIGITGATVNADLSGSDFNISETFKAYDGTLNITSTSTNLNFINGVVPKMYLWGSGQTFNNIVSTGNTEVIGSLNCQLLTASTTFYINTNWAAVTCTDASFSGNTTLDCNFTANNVSVNTPGTFIKLRTLNLSGNLTADGLCGSPIQISPIDFLAQATINKPSGSVNVDYTIITSVNATGGAVFNATNSVDNGNSAGWNFTAPTPRTLYWVGGTGDWHDIAHWATSSGGAGGNCLPASYDNVIFDAGSFSQAGETVTVNGPQANCSNMTWTGVSNSPTFATGALYSISIYGSLTLDPAMNLGSTSFEFAGSNSGNTIYSAGHTLGGVLINGTGTWSLADALNCGGIQIYKGTFNTTNFDITAGGFSANGIGNQIFVDLGTSTLYLSVNYMAFDPTVTINSDDASIVFEDPAGATIYAQFSDNSIFNNITSVSGTYYSGNLICNNFDAQAGVHVTRVTAQTAQFAQSSTANSVSAGTVTFGPGVLSFGFDTLDVINTFNSSSNCSSTLSLHPYVTAPAKFFMTNGSVTVDYAYISGVEAIGGGGFTANNSWDLGNNSGWTFNSAASRDLYWVGGTGTWNDASHWSLSSGGAGGECQPGMQDNVMFDANSFSSGDSVYVHPTLGVYMNNLTFTSIPNGTLLYSSSGNTPMNIGGSLTMPAELDLWSVAFRMTSSNTGNTLTTGGNSIIDLNFSGSGDWSLQDNLTTGNFHAGNGTFMSNGHFLDLGGVNIGGNAVLDFGTSTVQVLGFWSGVGPTVIGGNASLVMTSSVLSLDLENAHFYTVLFTGNANVDSDFSCDRLWAMGTFTNINGEITAGSANFKSHVTLPNNFICDSLVLDNPGKLVLISNVTVNDYIIANGNSGFPVQIEGINGNGILSKPSGQVCLDYVLIKDITATGGAQFFAGANGVDLGGNSGWTFGPCIPLMTDVWPGDANYDLTANNLDILNIGLAYGYTGPARATISTAWQAELCADWSAQFANGANLKHADTDGSGIVNTDDTTAVGLNYGSTHPPRLTPPVPSSLPPAVLYVVSNPDSASLSDTVEVEIYLGTSSQAVDSIYGIAFTINFDSTLISSSYLSVDYTGCWMGTNQVDMIGFSRNLLTTGHVDMALVRTDHLNANGFGLLGKLGIVIVDNVGAKVTMPITLSNITAITANEFPISITTSSDSVVIDTAATVGLYEPATFDATFYPNPVNDVLYINTEVQLNGYEIYNVAGALLAKEENIKNTFSINTRNLEQGVYFVKLISDTGVAVKRIEVLRN